MAAVDTNDPSGTTRSGETALAPLGYGTAGVPDASWSYGLPMRPEILTSKASPVGLLYALRRRWILAVGLGLLLGGTLTALVWYFVPIRTEAAALLKVSRSPVSAVNEAPALAQRDLDFEVFKRTTVQMIKSFYVMQATLRKPKVAKLPIVQKQKDAVAWLTSELMVDYPGDAEILRIAMKGDNSDKQVETIVTEVKNTYLEEIVGGDAADRVRNKEKLAESVRINQREIQQKSDAIRDLERTGGTGERALIMKRLALQNLDNLIGRRQKVEDAMVEVRRRLTLLKQKAESDEPLRVSQAAINEATAKDEDIRQIKKDIKRLEKAISEEERRARDPNQKSILGMRESLESMRQELETRIRQIREDLEEKLSSTDGKGEVVTEEMLKSQYQAHAGELSELEHAIAESTKKVQSIEDSTVEIEAKKADLRGVTEITSKMAHELKLLEMTMFMSGQRIVAIDEQANVQPTSDAVRKYAAVGFAGMLGFGLMIFGIAYIEFQSRRLNTPRDVNEGLGIRVMGDLPPLSGRAWRRMASGKSSAGTLQAVLAESIDNIRTSLIHATSVGSPRVVMVTSAEPGEGKTTVATQLAASLARAGRRTLLIDGDLRSPAVHRVFDQALEPGLCEFLRGDAEAPAIVHPTQADNLWLVPAGRCDLRSVQALANSKISTLFDLMRKQFEFVIVDAGPVLKVADSLLLGQQVDAVVLSVLRDVSKVPSVYEACERLKSVGVTVMGSVVNGVSGRAPRGLDLHLTEIEAS